VGANEGDGREQHKQERQAAHRAYIGGARSS